MKDGFSKELYRNGIFEDYPKKISHEIHGILNCQNCKRAWNRDVVGGINIFDIYEAHMHGEARRILETKRTNLSILGHHRGDGWYQDAYTGPSL